MTQSSINSHGEVVLYEAPDGEIRLDVRLEQDTVWLTQAQMAELFGRERSVVTKHIRNVFREGYGDKWAVPVPTGAFPNITNTWKTLEDFMRFCNIANPPLIERGLFS